MRRDCKLAAPVLAAAAACLLLLLAAQSELTKCSVAAAAELRTSHRQQYDTSIGATSNDALQYLRRFGYLNGSAASSSQLISEESFSSAVESFQRFAGIEPTGTLDEQTVNIMQMPRCGNKDSFNNHQHSHNHNTNRVHRASRALSRIRRYALQGSKWRRTELTYRISQYPTRFQHRRNEVDSQIEKAFGIWSSVAPIDFIVRREGRVHIDIRFASGDHGDGDAFDGPGNTLAHAYFPQYGGDVHFDDQEFWTIDSYAGTNIFQVAAHELGHSLGLGHSSVREALMAPFYQKYKPNFKLHADDTLAIRALYGEKPLDADSQLQPSPPPTSSTTTPSTTTSTTTTTTSTVSTPNMAEATLKPPVGSRRFTPNFHNDNSQEANSDSDDENSIDGGFGERSPPSTAPSVDLCAEPTIDAITRTEDGSSYVFKGDLFWLLTADGLARGYPRKIADEWQGLPGNLDAALTWADGKTFFFKGKQYWRFRNKRRDVGYPKLINVGFAGLPDDIDAAFVWSGNGRTYVFKGAEYWRFDSKSDPPVAADYPRAVKFWTGVPAHLSAAFKWDNNVTYFFKGNQYYRFNDKEFRIEARGRPAFPRNTAEWWFGCTHSNLAAKQQQSPAMLMPASADDWQRIQNLDAPVAKALGTHINEIADPPPPHHHQYLGTRLSGARSPRHEVEDRPAPPPPSLLSVAPSSASIAASLPAINVLLAALVAFVVLKSL